MVFRQQGLSTNLSKSSKLVLDYSYKSKGRLTMIGYLFHLYKSGTEPFRTLSILSEEDAIKIMRDLYMEGAIFWERFEDATQYLRMRKQIEQNLRQAFIVKGGEPHQVDPIYRTLGKSKWMQTDIHAATLATTTQTQMPLSLFQECDVS